MTLMIEDLSASRELDKNENEVVCGGMDWSNYLNQSSYMVSAPTLYANANAAGPLSTAVALNINVSPQINTQIANIVDTDTIMVLNSIIGENSIPAV